MRADDLILFADVADAGSFSRVAEQYELTNSVVSKRISRLEETLGVQLFYRTTRKLTVSEAGQVLLEQARQVRLAVQDARETISGYGERLCGHIRLSVPTISGNLLLSDAVAEFCNLHPGISVDMSLNNRFVDLIDDGYDLVIRTGYLEDSSLIARHIVDSQWVVFASPDYIRRYGRPQQPQQLTGHNCLRYAYQMTGASEWEFRGSSGNYITRVSGNFSTDDARALRKAVLGGHGIAYVPKCLIYEDLQQGRLLDLFPDQVAKRLGIYAVYPFTRHPPRKVRLLIEHIRAAYGRIAYCFT